MVTLLVVVMSKIRDCGPLLIVEIFAPSVEDHAHCAPEGNPDPQERVTASGNPAPVGVTRTEKLTLPPDGMVLGVLFKVALTEKSFRGTLVLIFGVVVPAKLSVAEFPKEPVPCSTVVGAVAFTVTVAALLMLVEVVIDVPTVPRVQIRVPVIFDVWHDPVLAVAEGEADPGSSESVKTTPETGSPAL